MITIEQLRAQRDALYSQQLSQVEAAIDAGIQQANLTGPRAWTYQTSSLNSSQIQWLIERYRAYDYTVTLLQSIVDNQLTNNIQFTWAW